MAKTESATPTTPDLFALVQTLIEQLRAVSAKIPGFTLPHPDEPDLRGPAGAVPQSAIDAALSATLAHKALAEAVDAAQVQADAEFVRLFADVRDEAKILYTGLDYTIRSKRFNAGQATLNVLSIARRLARRRENAQLTAHIEAIEAGLRRRRRNTKSPEQPAPAGNGS